MVMLRSSNPDRETKSLALRWQGRETAPQAPCSSSFVNKRQNPVFIALMWKNDSTSIHGFCAILSFNHP
jgi:hypothetical protein